MIVWRAYTRTNPEGEDHFGIYATQQAAMKACEVDRDRYELPDAQWTDGAGEYVIKPDGRRYLKAEWSTVYVVEPEEVRE